MKGPYQSTTTPVRCHLEMSLHNNLIYSISTVLICYVSKWKWDAAKENMSKLWHYCYINSYFLQKPFCGFSPNILNLQTSNESLDCYHHICCTCTRCKQNFQRLDGGSERSPIWDCIKTLSNSSTSLYVHTNIRGVRDGMWWRHHGEPRDSMMSPLFCLLQGWWDILTPVHL